MNYELAKKLKEAGFPQKYEPLCEHQRKMMERGEMWGGFEAMKHQETCDEPGACVPTLSELIEACGDGFKGLWRHLEKKSIDGKSWTATRWKRRGHFMKYWGNTPEEAVSNLWLALNQEEHE